ncbi:hypothetical protein Ade02nite_19450 [Paractinoplanes deccanensis]|uniref:Uncharacterized protein n=1 Tax=Paractinoplanes deccanensis TaxID=113561 RepID=A0ABQ3XZZ7_9ACTN|nr:hypothetical protein [Actinoplanes deccanensis]GID73304.1 hypothetical protein Ade02nite_19450 [Actinoplanes deccanensis]
MSNLERDLTELEASDPNVRQPAERLDEVTRSILRTSAVVVEDPSLVDMPTPDDGTCTCGHDGLDSMFHLGECPHAEQWRNRGKAKPWPDGLP